jgi:hypothetical protein
VYHCWEKGMVTDGMRFLTMWWLADFNDALIPLDVRVPLSMDIRNLFPILHGLLLTCSSSYLLCTIASTLLSMDGSRHLARRSDMASLDRRPPVSRLPPWPSHRYGNSASHSTSYQTTETSLTALAWLV